MNTADVKSIETKYKDDIVIFVGRIITPKTKHKYYLDIDEEEDLDFARAIYEYKINK